MDLCLISIHYLLKLLVVHVPITKRMFAYSCKKNVCTCGKMPSFNFHSFAMLFFSAAISVCSQQNEQEYRNNNKRIVKYWRLLESSTSLFYMGTTLRKDGLRAGSLFPSQVSLCSHIFPLFVPCLTCLLITFRHHQNQHLVVPLFPETPSCPHFPHDSFSLVRQNPWEMLRKGSVIFSLFSALSYQDALKQPTTAIICNWFDLT